MLIIGLTGGIGSGKTTVANLFKKWNVPIIEMDNIAKQITEKPEIIARIIKIFGNEVLNPDNKLNKPLLRHLVFNNVLKKKELESFLHPLIIAQVKEIIKDLNAPYCILVVPLLVETNFKELIDRILVVDVEEESQINRVMERDQCTSEDVKKIMLTQATRKARLACADDIIVNDGNFENLKKHVRKLHEFYSSLK